jgi:hypothetical protein
MKTLSTLTVGLGLAFSLALGAGCSSSSGNKTDAFVFVEPDMPPPIDSRVTDAGVTIDMTPPTPDAGCFTNPTTYVQLLNACTSAQKVDKTPSVPPTDGGLLPLP